MREPDTSIRLESPEHLKLLLAEYLSAHPRPWLVGRGMCMACLVCLDGKAQPIKRCVHTMSEVGRFVADHFRCALGGWH